MVKCVLVLGTLVLRLSSDGICANAQSEKRSKEPTNQLVKGNLQLALALSGAGDRFSSPAIAARNLADDKNQSSALPKTTSRLTGAAPEKSDPAFCSRPRPRNRNASPCDRAR